MSIWKPPRPTLTASTSLFRWFYWNSYRASHHALHNAGPIHLVALDKIWGEREKSGIWLSVICPVAVCSKALVRRHHIRRVRAALATVFNEQGLGRNGKVMDGQTTSLQGTIHVLLFSPIVQAESSRIRQDCATMVYNIMKRESRGQALSSPFDRQSTKGSNNSYRTLKQGERLNVGDKKTLPNLKAPPTSSRRRNEARNRALEIVSPSANLKAPPRDSILSVSTSAGHRIAIREVHGVKEHD